MESPARKYQSLVRAFNRFLQANGSTAEEREWLAAKLVGRWRSGAPMTLAPDVDTLRVRREGAVLFVEMAAPPMNLLGPEMVRDLVSLIQQAEADAGVKVLVLGSADPDYFISHVDVTRIEDYRHEAAKLTGEASIGLMFRHLI